MSFLWESVVLLLSSMTLLRVAGKKSISRMTTLETVTVLSIGTIMGHALHERALWKTIVVIAIFVTVLITVQWLQMKFNTVERVMIGSATPVILNGRLDTNNMKKLRLSVDQLEMRLREHGIRSYSDVLNATIESDGELGYELTPKAKPATVGDVERLLQRYLTDVDKQNAPTEHKKAEVRGLFEEIATRRNPVPVPSKLE